MIMLAYCRISCSILKRLPSSNRGHWSRNFWWPGLVQKYHGYLPKIKHGMENPPFIDYSSRFAMSTAPRWNAMGWKRERKLRGPDFLWLNQHTSNRWLHWIVSSWSYLAGKPKGSNMGAQWTRTFLIDLIISKHKLKPLNFWFIILGHA